MDEGIRFLEVDSIYLELVVDLRRMLAAEVGDKVCKCVTEVSFDLPFVKWDDFNIAAIILDISGLVDEEIFVEGRCKIRAIFVSG